jgi:hypothetical protein
MASLRQWSDPDHWSPWYQDGRSTVCGWRNAPGSEKPTFDAMRFDPVVLAFGPQVKPLPRGSVTPVRPWGGWEESFLRSPRVAQPGGDEVIGWRLYKSVGQERLQNRQGMLQVAFFLTDRFAGGTGVVFVPTRTIELPLDDPLLAIPYLSLRAALTAVAADRDHPDGYWALFIALNDRDLPLSEAERALAQVTALRQCLVRLPPPDQYRPGVYLTSPTQVSYILANLYLGRKREFGGVPMGIPVNHLAFQLLNPPRGSGFLRAAVVPAEGVRGGRPERRWVGAFQSPPHDRPAFLLPLDEARETLQLAQKYLQVAPPESEEALRGIQKELERELQDVETELGRMNNRYEQRKMTAGGQMKLAAQVEAALEFGLVGEALRILTDKDTDLGKEFGPRALEVALSMTALQLALGRLEDAASGLDTLTSDPDVQKALSDENARPVVQMLRFHKLTMEGNYAEAGAIMESLDGRMVGLDPAKSLRQQFDPKPFVESKQSLVAWATFSPLASLLAPTPMDVAVRSLGPPIALNGFSVLQNNLAEIRRRDSEFYTRRGLLSLAEGDIPAARARFLQARPTAEQKAENAKWGLSEYRNQNAERYLRLIDEAAKRAERK